MKTINNSLKLVFGTWDDPGDYPSGAGSGPLPSRQFVEYIDGTVEVELDAEDQKILYDYADVEVYSVTFFNMMNAWLKDEPGVIDHDISGLTVKSWCLEKCYNDNQRI